MRGALHHVHPLHPSHVLARPQKAHEAIVARQRRGRHEAGPGFEKGILGFERDPSTGGLPFQKGGDPYRTPERGSSGRVPQRISLVKEEEREFGSRDTMRTNGIHGTCAPW